MRFAKVIAAGVVGVAVATIATAGGHNLTPEQAAVKARKAHMQLFAYNLGGLGAMAKGEVEYDAAMATAAANNMVALSSMNQMRYWAAGTDSDAMDESRALPALFEKTDDVIAKATALNEASVSLAAVAGDGLEALQGAMGPVGAACGACHKAYQKPRG